MKFKNSGNDILIKYNATEYTLPNGTFEINDDAFSYFIIKKSRSLGFSLDTLDDTPQKKVVREVLPISKIEDETPAEKPVAPKEDKVEEIKKKK